MLGPGRLIAALAAALLGCLAASGAARAAAGPWLDHDQARLRLIAAEGAVGEAARLSLGLQFELQPGWKIYWRSPGDAGFPPVLDWTESENLAAAEVRWPVPKRFSLFGLETFGYSDQVVLPIEATLQRPGAPLRLSAAINYLACEEICIPYDGTLSLELPAGASGTGPEAALIAQYQSRVPGDGRAVGLSIERAVLTGEVEAPWLEVVARSSEPFAAPDLLVEGPPGHVFAKPEVTLGDGGRLATLRLESARGPQAEGVLEGKQLTLTVTDGDRGLERAIVARYAAVPAPLVPGMEISLLAVLGLAVLGGLILNLMPCVLPVLSIKLLSVVSHGGRERGAVRISFLASAVGILFSFLVLAAIALALKAAGLAVGWGIQFQQPLFLAGMAVVVTLFAANLFGWFEIPLPAWAGALGGADHGHGLLGHFLAGAFATLLATPCSAPFLGTAVGFALARGAVEILLVFTALGLGLALPYLLVAAAPGLATRLPRPGHWMITLRRLLALALAATAVWLVWVMAGQVGDTAALLAGLCLVALAAILALHRRLPRRAAAALVALALIGSFALPAGLATRPPPTPAAAWQPLDRARIDALVGAGQVVFVDVTADWCLTCKVNKALVLDRDPVAEQLSDGAVVAMRGDWTQPSDEIAGYLAGFGRYGIPFNAVYGPGLPEGEALPELLTSDAVMDALERARGG